MPAAKQLPELTPLSLTRELLDVSVTERGQFRTCRRRWFFETIENLEPKTPTLALSFGEGVHSGLEEYYLQLGKGEDRIEAMGEGQKAFDRWYKKVDAQLERDEEPMEIQNEMFDLHKLGKGMLDNYTDFEEVAKTTLGDVVAVEGLDVRTQKEMKFKRPEGYPVGANVKRHTSGRILVPIVNPLTRDPVMRTADGRELTAHLTARIDLLTERKTPKKGLWVVDHKTAKRMPNNSNLDIDDQVTGYCYVVWRMTGKIPRGVVFNVLMKHVPKEPRVGQRGLSYAKDQLTTANAYREALKEHDLVTRSGKITSENHAECLASLLAHGWDRFFMRYEIMRNEHQLHAFEERLFFEYLDMEEALENHEILYPNPHAMLCGNCAVKPICLAIEDGSDYQDIIDNRYRVGKDRKA